MPLLLNYLCSDSVLYDWMIVLLRVLRRPTKIYAIAVLSREGSNVMILLIVKIILPREKRCLKNGTMITGLK